MGSFGEGHVKVTIEQLTEKRLFKTSYALHVSLEFSDSEKIAIKQAGLGEYLFMEAGQPTISEDGNRYTIGTIATNGGFKWYYPDLVSVRIKDAEVREKLKELKAVIDQNAGPAKKIDSFEL